MPILTLPRTASALILGAQVALLLLLVLGIGWWRGHVAGSALAPAVMIATGTGLVAAIVQLRVNRRLGLPREAGFLVLLVAASLMALPLASLPAMLLALPASWLGLLPDTAQIGAEDRWLPLEWIFGHLLIADPLLLLLIPVIALASALHLLLLQKRIDRLGRRAKPVARAVALPLVGGWIVSAVLSTASPLIWFEDGLFGGGFGRRKLAPHTNGIAAELCLQAGPGMLSAAPDAIFALCPHGEGSRLRTLYTNWALDLSLFGDRFPSYKPALPSEGFDTALESVGLADSLQAQVPMIPDTQARPQQGSDGGLIFPLRELEGRELELLWPLRIGRIEIASKEALPGTRLMYCWIADTYRCDYYEVLPGMVYLPTRLPLLVMQRVPFEVLKPLYQQPDLAVSLILR